MAYRAAIYKFTPELLRQRIRDALEWVDWRAKIYADSRVWIKPNLTFPEYRPGVTTSPHFMAALLDVLRERTRHLTVFESDGGNNSYPMEKAFKAHNLVEICGDRDVRLVNLSRLKWESVEIPVGRGKSLTIPQAGEILKDADLTISAPVPKMHFITRYTGAIKNYWGAVPDSMRLRNHYFFNYAINTIMRLLKAGLTVVDGEYFLDNNGPVTGNPVEMNLVLASDYPLTADMVLMNIMGVDPSKIGYIRSAWQMSPGPHSLAEVKLNTPLEAFKNVAFTYQRDPVDYLALLGFHSKWVTWLVYLSPLRKFMHWLVGVMRGGSRQVEAYYNDIVHDDSAAPPKAQEPVE